VRFLVSVRSLAEAEAALDGGADIIDAKEPALGALGAVAPAELARIAARVPPAVPFSAALGDAASAAEAAAIVGTLELEPRAAPTYIKIGALGIRTPAALESMLRAAVEAAARLPARPVLVAVAYADANDSDAPPALAVSRAAEAAGAGGVLLDTLRKDGRTLFDWQTTAAIDAWLAGARQARLLTALAGSLGAAAVPLLRRLGPDIVGVRGAACEGGREGQISAQLVRQLRAALRLAAA
jgi:(5-formylfuran-3-yl)methyl phosphate synthase